MTVKLPLAALLCAPMLVACGSTGARPSLPAPPLAPATTAWPTPIDLPTPNGVVFDDPSAKRPLEAVTYYFDQVERNRCVDARFYTEYEFYTRGDICIGPYESSEGIAEDYRNVLAYDAWRLDPHLPVKRLSATEYVYPVQLHVTKHGCSGSICANGWHTVLVDVRTGQKAGYNSGPGVWLLHSLGTGP